MKSFGNLTAFSLFFFLHLRDVFPFEKAKNNGGFRRSMVRPPRPSPSISFPPSGKQYKGLRRLAENGDIPSDLTIATYNLWNIMFHWEVRKIHIADMVCYSVYNSTESYNS